MSASDPTPRHGPAGGRGARAPARPRLRPVVTGVGPISSIGAGQREMLQSLERLDTSGAAPLHDPREEGIPFPPMPLHRPSWKRVGEILADPPLRDLPPDPELRLGVAAARLALEDAGASEIAADAALVATWEAPGMDRFLRGLFEDMRRGPAGEGDEAPEPALRLERFHERHRDAAYGTHSFLHLHLLARALGVHGPTLFLNNACASGLYAIEAAVGLLETGKSDIAIVVAAESPVFPAKHAWFREAGLASSDGRLRPFDRDRTGLILGEGSAAIVVETLEHALARGARVYAEYLGGSMNQEGWKIAVPSFTEPYHEEVVRGACAAAGIEPRDVDAVLAHGAGTSLSDAYEAQGMRQVFGEWPERPVVTALKGYFGHTLGASALLELAALLVWLEAGLFPGSAGFSTPDPKLKLRLLERTEERRVDVLLKLANGFAGFNAGAVFARLDWRKGS